MKLKDILNFLSIYSRLTIYEIRQDCVGTYVDVLTEGKNLLDMRLDKNVLQRDVITLSAHMGALYIVLDGDGDET